MTAVLRVLLAVFSGAALYSSYAPIGWWFMAPLGITALYLVFSPWGDEKPSYAAGAGLGFVQSLVLCLLLLPWIGEFVGPLPYVALAVVLSLYHLVLGIIGVAIARWKWGFALFPLAYLMVEWGRSTFPFGGFPWVRLSWGQVEGPVAALGHFGGPVLITFAVVLFGSAVAAILLGPGVRTRVIALLVLPAVAAPSLASNLAVDRDAGIVGERTMAAIQGNVPRLGLDFNAQERAVLDNHNAQTAVMGEAVASGEVGQPDVVIWPENSSDPDPFRDAYANQAARQAAEDAQAPVLIGTKTKVPGEEGPRGTMVVFDPESGPGERHDKRYLQPFGETMPLRDVLIHVTDLVELAGNFQPGDDNGVVDMGGTAVGVATCFEVVFDEAYRMTIRDGAQILTTPTNNATFGLTDMTYQQLAMSRMRAIETDRAVVVAATSGVSAMVRPDGSVTMETGKFEPGFLVDTLPLKDTITPSVRIGFALEMVLVIMGVIVSGAAVWLNRNQACAAYMVGRSTAGKKP